MKKVNYITQLSADDIAKMLAAGNIRAGKGIKVEATGEGLVISIDETQMIEYLWTYFRSRSVQDSIGGRCSNVDSLRNIKNTITLDPLFYD